MANELLVKFIADVSGFVSGVDSAMGKLNSLDDGPFASINSKLDTFGSAATNLGASMTALSAPIIGVGAAALTMAGQFEQTEIAFTTLLGNAETAKTFLADLSTFAAQTPFDLPGLTDASQKLLAMGFAATEVIPIMTSVGDAVAGLGGGADMIQGVVTALGQIQAKGKASAEEMMQLAERGIPAWQMLADAMGTSVAATMKAVSDGAVSSSQAIDALVAGMGEKFGGLMAQQSQTFLGQLSTLKDNFGQILRDIGAAILPLATQALEAFQPMVGIISGVVAAFTTLPEPVQSAIIAVVGLTTVVGPIVAAIGLLASGIAAVGAPVAAAAVAIVALGGAFAGMAAAIGSNNTILTAVQEAFGGIADKVIEAKNAIVAEFSTLWAALTELWNSSGMAELFDSFLDGMLTGFTVTLQAVAAVVSGGLDVLVAAVQTFTALVTGDWSGFFGGLADIARGFFTAFVGVFNAMFQAIDDSVTADLGAVRDSFNNIMSEIGTFVANVFVAMLNNAATAINGILSVISLLPGGKTIAEGALNGIKAVTETLKGAFDFLTTSAEGSKKKLDTDLPGAAGTASGALAGLEAKAGTTSASIIGVGGAATTAKTELDKFDLTKFQNWLKDVEAQALKLRPALDDLDIPLPSVETSFTNLGTAVGGVDSSLTGLDTTISGMQPTWDAAKQAAADLEGAYGALGVKAQSVKDTELADLKTALGTMDQAFRDGKIPIEDLQAAQEAYAKAAAGEGNSAANASNTLATALGSVVTKAGEIGTKFITDLANNPGSAIGTAIGSFKALGTAIVNDLITVGMDVLLGGIDDLVGKIPGINQLKDAFSDLGSSIGGAGAGATGSAGSLGSSLKSSFESVAAVINVISGVVTAAASVVGAIGTLRLEGTMNAVELNTRQTFGTLRDDIKPTLWHMSGKADLLEGQMNTIGGLISDIKGIGESIDARLLGWDTDVSALSGIESNTGAAVGILGSILTAIQGLATSGGSGSGGLALAGTGASGTQTGLSGTLASAVGRRMDILQRQRR